MPNIIHVPQHRNTTKQEAAELLGIQIYDTALPQPWLNEVAGNLSSLDVDASGKLYDILLTSLVWCYDQAKIFGAPYPLTLKAWAYLKALDMKTGTHYVDETHSLLNVLDIG